MRFTKMHGNGNDYVFVDCFQEKVPAPQETAVNISDRHFGVGSDGLILIEPSQVADLKMRIFNADGSEAEMCGNGVRCVAKYAYEHGLVTAREIDLETLAGVKHLQLSVSQSGTVESVRVNMGRPIFDPAAIPIRGQGPDALDQEIVAGSEKFHASCLSMGNPHCVIVVDDVENFPVEIHGPEIETHELFPQRTNVEFVQILSPQRIRQRTWERGSGETLACGTGACAVAVACSKRTLTQRHVTIELRGGDLDLEWAENGNVYMTGPAVEVFTGDWPD